MNAIEHYVFVEYNPRVTWHFPIYNRLNSTKNSVLKNRWSNSGSTELPELSLALAMKLVLLKTVVDRFNSDYAKLLEKAEGDEQRIREHIATGTVWRIPNSDTLAFELIAGIDAFIFELRSTYEILGKFLVTFFRVLFERPIREEGLKSILRDVGLDTSWTLLLQTERKLFFHDTAPWLAISVSHSAGNQTYELIVVRKNVSALTNPNDFARLKEYNDIYNGFGKALIRLQQYAISEIDRFEE